MALELPLQVEWEGCRHRMASFASIFILSRLRGKGEGWKVEGVSEGEGRSEGGQKEWESSNARSFRK